MTAPSRLLVVGGYGTFGGRLVDLLQGEPCLTVVVAGRSFEKAAVFCRARSHAKARLVAAAFDRRGDVSAQLAALAPDVLVDASGPFQGYGEGRYALVEACIARRVHYLDLADGSDFVAGVGAYDSAAKAAGVYVLSGVSSFPVLTAAVVRRLAHGMTRVRSIRGGIAPSPYAGVGENVIRAIAAYAGRSTHLRRNGVNTTGHAFTECLRFTIAPPGLVPLRSTLFSLVDVPDLVTLPTLWPEAEDVWMGAGPVPEALHRVLIALAWLVRCRLASSLTPLAPLMFRVANRLRWGEHRGGMFVELQGQDRNGRRLTRSWHLLAEGDDGPLIPSMAVEAIVRKAVAGHQPVSGARAALRDLELTDYEALFARRTIYTGTRDDEPQGGASLHAVVLGAAWHALPPEIRHMHTIDGKGVAEGRCRVERGSRFAAKLVALLFAFPRGGDDVPIAVRFEVANGIERWTRAFGESLMSSSLHAGRGRSQWMLCERFGPFVFAQALVVEGIRLRLVLRRWSVFGMSLPLWLGPRSNSYETVHDGRFRFFVEISHPLAGMIVRYQGWLTRVDPQMEKSTPRSPDT